MSKLFISTLYKGCRKLYNTLKGGIYTPIAKINLFFNNARYGKNLTIRGFLNINITRRGKVIIGDGFHVNSGSKYNVIGRNQRTTFWVEGCLNIGNNVGVSSTAIICHREIIIGDNVTIGGNTVIYDTDFHSIHPLFRQNKIKDREHTQKKKVVLKNNCFIGAHCTILKGVTIGENSVVGASSVVTKNIPDNEIWAGNPAKFIRMV